jgi:hypothetical protein
MKNITYKYNVGDYVKFKDKFSSPTTGLVGREGTIAKITGIAFAYNNRPHYHINNIEGEVFAESCFAGLATESEFRAQQALATKVAKEQGPETNGDTGDSGEFEVLPLEEAKWYRISFSAKLTPDDLRAMKKCFFDAMNESMEIYDLEGLEIEEA